MIFKSCDRHCKNTKNDYRWVDVACRRLFLASNQRISKIKNSCKESRAYNTTEGSVS